ncbi:MAG: GAF domain-containing protein, partial [Opitutaceae bacterium]
MLAAQICQTPISIVALVDENRLWFKSSIGLALTETSRGVAFCAHAILNRDEVLEVNDAQADPRFADSPLVTSGPHVRFYAGAPLVAPDGHVLGALCVIDRVPRQLTAEQTVALRALSRHTVIQLELRRRARNLGHEVAERRRSEEALTESQQFLQSTIDALSAEIAILDESGVIVAVNAARNRFARENVETSGGEGTG